MNFDGEKEEKSEVKPSKVLHFRNIPPDTTEAELSRLASPFGTVTSVLILKGKNQAFLQLEDVRSAQAIVQYYSGFQPSLRGKVIYIQFSKREEITLTEDTHKEQQSAILLVTILNVQYAITLDVLHRVFSKYGQILKIIIFTKNGSFQSFVQFAEVASAVAAKRELENQNIYSQCCTLKIQYSQLSSLNVKVNSDKCRDYSLPSDTQLPFSDPVPWNWSPSPSHPAFPQPNYSPSNGNNANSKNNNNTNNNNNNNNNNSNHNNNNNNNNSAHSSCVLIASGINPQTTTDELFTLFGVYGDVVRVKILYNKKDTALLQFATPQQASIAIENLNSLPFRGQRLKVSYSKHQSISLPKPSDNEDEDGMEYTKDYSNSPLHRYKIVGSKNFQHITAPSSVLHLSNIPLSATEELLYDLFSKFGSVNTVKFFTKDKRMALVEYSSVEEAVGALVSMHNYSIGDQNIRVSFSKTSINSR